MQPGVRFLWKLLPTSWRRGFWQSEPDFLLARSTRNPKVEKPLVVAGLFRSANGLGESARAIYQAMIEAGLNPIAVDLTSRFTEPDLDVDFPLTEMTKSRMGTLVLVLNSPETKSALVYLGMFRWRAWHIVGLWAWELERFPSAWNTSFVFLGQIWCVSSFVASVISSHDKAPITHVVPNPIKVKIAADTNQRKSSLTATSQKFRVLIAADALSSFDRKNIAGAIHAFRSAFGDDSRCELLIKARNLDADCRARIDLLEAIAGAQNIEVVTESLSRSEYLELIAGTDVYFSPHRAEGFGIVIAEMMALGKPVVATGYSGNTMFMNASNSILLDYDMVPVSDRYGVYEDKESFWAEPDLDQAALELRSLFQSPERGRVLGERAQQDIGCQLSYSRVGELICDLLRPKE